MYYVLWNICITEYMYYVLCIEYMYFHICSYGSKLRVQALEGTGSFLQKIPFLSAIFKVIIGEYIRNLKDNLDCLRLNILEGGWACLCL